MADLSCPVCSADFPLSGDEQTGDEVFCTYCGSPFKFKGSAASDDDCGLEEDF